MIFGIIPISINFESIINQIENEVTEMDDLIKGVKIGKILTKDDEKKETKKIVAIVLAVIAAVAAVAGAAYAIYRFVMMTLKMISKISLKTKMKTILKKNKN